MAGMEQSRSIPAFAPQTFKDWFAAREPRNVGKPDVLLFADTFNNFYHPDVAQAAVEVLEDAGFHVNVPMQDVCCGRPLYDYGFLDTAERWLSDLLHKLQPHIQAGTPMVVLEPSCWAVFKDEMTNLFPNDADAQRLRQQTYLLTDFLKECAPHYRPPKLQAKALLHGHCHHKSLDKLGDKEFGELKNEKEMLEEMGMQYDAPADGCCGMAGAFGFERGDHYDVSIACGERVLLPAVRKAADEDVIIANGFSCHEQVTQCTDRRPLHVAQVLQLAKRHGGRLPSGRPESEFVRQVAREHRAAAIRTGLFVAAGAAAGLIAYRGRKQQRSVACARTH
jgi:Fe-S oxidoreductase